MTFNWCFKKYLPNKVFIRGVVKVAEIYEIFSHNIAAFPLFFLFFYFLFMSKQQFDDQNNDYVRNILQIRANTDLLKKRKNEHQEKV